MQLLLITKANVNVQKNKYAYALQTTLLNDHEKIMLLLLNTKTNVNVQRKRYENAVQTASNQNYEQLIRLLLNAGTDPVHYSHTHEKTTYHNLKQNLVRQSGPEDTNAFLQRSLHILRTCKDPFGRLEFRWVTRQSAPGDVWRAYCKSTLKPRPFPATKSLNGMLGTRTRWVSAKAMMTSFSSLGIVKQSKGDEDQSVSLISAMANSTMCHQINLNSLNYQRDRVINHNLSPKLKLDTVRQQMSRSFSPIRVGFMSFPLTWSRICSLDVSANSSKRLLLFVFSVSSVEVPGRRIWIGRENSKAPRPPTSEANMIFIKILLWSILPPNLSQSKIVVSFS